MWDFESVFLHGRGDPFPPAPLEIKGKERERDGKTDAVIHNAAALTVQADRYKVPRINWYHVRGFFFAGRHVGEKNLGLSTENKER